MADRYNVYFTHRGMGTEEVKEPNGYYVHHSDYEADILAARKEVAELQVQNDRLVGEIHVMKSLVENANELLPVQLPEVLDGDGLPVLGDDGLQ